MSSTDLYRDVVNQDEEYSQQLCLFYVGSSETPPGGENTQRSTDKPPQISSSNSLQAPASQKAHKSASSSGNLQRLQLPRAKSPLHHCLSAPEDLKQLVPSSSSIETTPSPSYHPIQEAFSTWDDAPIIHPKLPKETILQKYEEQEKKFYEKFLSGGNLQVPVSADENTERMGNTLTGTEHLRNLVRLLEQLSYLHEQNTVLRKKCAYLEDVKTLLKVRTMPGGFVESPKERKGESLITRAQSKVMHYLGTPSSNGASRRESRVASDSSDGRPAQQSMHKRSQSVGSIDMVEADLAASPIIKPSSTGGHRQDDSVKSPKSPCNKSPGNKSPALRLHSPTKKHGKRFSKWMRVKKVFSSKPEQQSKSMDGGVVSAEQLVKSNKHTARLTHMKSVDDGLLSPRETIKSDLPPSPSSVQSEPNSFANDDDDYEDYEEYVEIHPTQSSSTPSTDGFPTLRTRKLKDTDPPQVSLSDSEQTDSVNEKQTLQRRKSSPTLGFFRRDEEEAFSRGSLARLSRSSSLIETTSSRDKSVEKKSAWHKVKDIIHTRKDSLKKSRQKTGRTLSAGETGGTDADSEISPDSSSWEGHTPMNTDIDPRSPLVKAANLAGVVAATAPTPKLARRYTTKASSSRSQSPQVRGSGHRRRGGSVKGTPDSPATPATGLPSRESMSLLSTSPPVDVSALMGGMSDDFSKKMQEWEEKKKHGAFDKEAGGMAAEDMKNTDGSPKFSEEFIQKMVAWEKRMKSVKGSMSPPKRSSMYETFPMHQPSPGSTSPPHRAPSPQGEQPQNLSESFSKTVQEWQRVKETRAKTGTASPPPPETPQTSLVHTIAKPFEHRKSRKEQRSKSRDRDRDKSKQRLEKERQKIEKKEKKIEHERLKLEQLKMKLDLEHRPSHQQELSEEFVKKLHEWEIMNGVKRQDSDKHKRTGSEKLNREGVIIVTSGRERMLSDPSVAGDHIRQMVPGEAKEEEEGKSEEDAIRQKLEAENARLREEVEEKEEDVALIQDELEQLTCRFNMMNKEHSEQIENFKRELWATSRLGKYTIESDLLSATIMELHTQIAQLKNYDNQIWMAKEEVEERALRESEQRNRLETSLLCEIEQLQVALDGKLHRHGPEVLHQLYQYVVGIQQKLYDLRLGVIERNRVIEDLKRHLLVQEVTNKLLVADMQRKDLQLGFYRGCRRGGVIKRWKTFNGHDQMIEASILAARVGNRTPPPLMPDVPPSCKDIDNQLKKLSHGFGDSLNLHFEWLEGLKQQIKEIQEGANKSIQTSCPDLTEAESQTIMTLCRASSFLPVNGRSTPPNDKGIQTSDPEDAVKVKRELFKESRSSPIKPIRYNKAARLAREQSSGADSGSCDSSIEDRLVRGEDNAMDAETLAERRKSTGGYLTESVTGSNMVDHRQPPASPIIRSKYPRKLKTTDVRIHQLYGDGRTWKATPPRKLMRQRGKTVGVATAAGSQDEVDSDKIDENSSQAAGKLGPMRERTQSDGAVFHSKISPTLSVPTKDSTGTLWTSRVDKQQTGVSDLVNKYEDGRPCSQECRLSPSALRKPTVSPVRRLKTAAELIKDSEVRRRSRSATRETRTQWQSSSSVTDNKENRDLPSRVKTLVDQLSRDSTPSVEHDEEKQSRNEMKQLSHQLRSASTSELPRKSPHPLHDLTNDSSAPLVQKMKDSLLSSSGESTPRATPPKNTLQSKPHESPREGTVTSTKEKFEPVRRSTMSPQSPVRQNIMSSAAFSRPRPVSCPRGHSSSDHDSDELVWELAVPPKPATPPPTVQSEMAKRESQKRAERGGKIGCGSSSGGAISALCMHAASIDLEDSSPENTGSNSREEFPSDDLKEASSLPQQPPQQQQQQSMSAAAASPSTSAEKKGKGKTKFLDGNWLPKKFFRVSNGYLEVDSMESDAEVSPATLWSSTDILYLDCVPPSSLTLSLSTEESVC